MNTSTYQHRELQVLLQSEWSVASRIYYFATPNVLHIHPFEREDCTDMGLGFICWVDVQHIQYTHIRTHARTPHKCYALVSFSIFKVGRNGR